jgi:hypothetical protein
MFRHSPTLRLTFMKVTGTKVFFVLLIGLAIGGYYWWQQRAPEPAPQVLQAAAPVQAITPPGTPEPTAPAANTPPPVLHPLEAVPSATAPALPELSKADAFVLQALGSLLSQPHLRAFVLADDFVRHVVATVDNLPRSQASWTVWPVNRTPGRFTTMVVESAGSQSEIISADNAARYAPFVKFIESVDSTRAVALYVQMYPLFQQAYAELGFPKRYFNDRLVEVIDHLLATPVVTEPIQVKLVEVKGSVKSLQPWTRYEFADPALEQLSAGQKILLRVGPSHLQRLQAKLREFRAKIVTNAPRG